MDDMRIDGSAYREKFLDSFPLTETEVDGLVALYNATCQYDKGTSLMMDCKRHLLDTRPMEQDAKEEEEQALDDLEQAISPNILNGILEACNHVAPLLPFDVPDDKTVPLCRAYYFLEAMVSLLGRRGTRFLIHFVYDQVQAQQAAGEPTTAKALMEFLYQYLRATVLLTPSFQGEGLPCDPPQAWIQSLQQSAETTTASISKQSWTTWINDTLPEATRCMCTLYHQILLGPNQPYGPTSPPPFGLPHPQPEPLLGLPKNPLLPLTLACLSPALGKSWQCLYSSHRDGSSFLRFQQALLSYAGPTCLLIQPKQQQNTNNSTGVFGYYTDCPWRESTTWVGGGGGGDSFLFAYHHQHLGVYWPTYKGEQYMYLNTQPQNGMNHNHNNNKLRGLAIGGIDADTPRVHLTPSLEGCQATATDTTYQSGPLLADDDSPFFDVDTLEVWAVHFTTRDEFEHYQQVGQDHWTRRQQARQRAATVDRAQFLDDFQSGAYLNGLYHHREQARGRHDFVVSVTDGHGYFLEGKPPSEAALTPRNTMDEGEGEGEGGQEEED